MRTIVERRQAAGDEQVQKKEVPDSKALTDNDIQRKDAVTLLLSAKDEETGESFPAYEIEDQLLTLLFAGFETLNSAMVCRMLLS